MLSINFNKSINGYNTNKDLSLISKTAEKQAYTSYAETAQNLAHELGAEVNTPQEAIDVAQSFIKSLRGY